MADERDVYLSDEALDALERGSVVDCYSVCIRTEILDGEKMLFIGFNSAKPWSMIMRALKDTNPELYGAMIAAVKRFNHDD